MLRVTSEWEEPGQRPTFLYGARAAAQVALAVVAAVEVEEWAAAGAGAEAWVAAWVA